MEEEKERQAERRQMQESDTDLNCSWCEDKHDEEETPGQSVDGEERREEEEEEEEQREEENNGQSSDKSTGRVEVNNSPANEGARLVPSIVHEKASSDESDDAHCDTEQSPVTLSPEKKSQVQGEEEEEEKAEEDNKEDETSSESHRRHNNRVSIIHLSFIRGRQMAGVKVNDKVHQRKGKERGEERIKYKRNDLTSQQEREREQEEEEEKVSHTRGGLKSGEERVFS